MGYDEIKVTSLVLEIVECTEKTNVIFLEGSSKFSILVICIFLFIALDYITKSGRSKFHQAATSWLEK